MMILLEPELEDRVNEGVGVSVSLYDVLFGQRLLIPADGLWRAKRIFSVDVLCIEMAFSVGDSDQHVDLGNGETINVSLKDGGMVSTSRMVFVAQLLHGNFHKR